MLRFVLGPMQLTKTFSMLATKTPEKRVNLVQS